MYNLPRLGVNIDHVATLRNARGEGHPSIIEIAKIVKDSGADSITVHLREDRRHIKDQDLKNLCNKKWKTLYRRCRASCLNRWQSNSRRSILYTNKRKPSYFKKEFYCQ